MCTFPVRHFHNTLLKACTIHTQTFQKKKKKKSCMFLKDLSEIWPCRLCSPIFFSVIVWNCPSWKDFIVTTKAKALPCSAFCAGEQCPNLSQIVTIECKFTRALTIAVQPWESWDPNTVSQNQTFLYMAHCISFPGLCIMSQPYPRTLVLFKQSK